MPIMIHGGGGGSSREYEYITGIDAQGKTAITIQCNIVPKGIILLPVEFSRSSVADFTFGVNTFAHFSDNNYAGSEYYEVDAREPRITKWGLLTDYATVAYSDNSITITLKSSDNAAFMSVFDAFVLG